MKKFIFSILVIAIILGNIAFAIKIIMLEKQLEVQRKVILQNAKKLEVHNRELEEAAELHNHNFIELMNKVNELGYFVVDTIEWIYEFSQQNPDISPRCPFVPDREFSQENY